MLYICNVESQLQIKNYTNSHNDKDYDLLICGFLFIKECTKCNITKDFSEFYKSKDKKDGFKLNCKSCCKQYSSSRKQQQKQYRLDNKEKQKQYYLDNLDRIKEKQKQYRLNNLDKLKELDKKHKKNNRDKINYYYKNKKSTDNLFKLTSLIRTSIRNSISGRGYTKKIKNL